MNNAAFEKFLHLIWEKEKKRVILRSHFRDVAQSGLEYASGGRGVGSSNLLIPTIEREAVIEFW